MGYGGTSRVYSCSRIKGHNRLIKKKGMNRKKKEYVYSQKEIDEIKLAANW